MYKWKEEHDAEALESKKMVELMKHLSQAEEALRKTRAECDKSLRANDKVGREVVKEDKKIKIVWMELMITQDFVTKYLRKEEELIREIAKA